ncbi:hypothetical protein [Lysinibacillus sp. RC79]
MSYKSVAKELGIDQNVRRWIKHLEVEGMKELDEKRAKAKGSGIDHTSLR